MSKNKNIVPLFIYILGFVIQFYGIFIFDGFLTYIETGIFKFALYAFFAFYCALLFAYLIIWKKQNKKIALGILVVLMIIQLITFPFTNLFYEYHDMYAYRLNKTNYLIRDTEQSRTQRDSEALLERYLEDKDLYFSEEGIFNHLNKFYTFSIYKSNFIYDNSIKRHLDLEQGKTLMDNEDYYSFVYMSRTEPVYEFYITLYIGDDYSEMDEIVMYTDKSNNLFFLPKAFENGGFNG